MRTTTLLPGAKREEKLVQTLQNFTKILFCLKKIRFLVGVIVETVKRRYNESGYNGRNSLSSMLLKITASSMYWLRLQGETPL